MMLVGKVCWDVLWIYEIKIISGPHPTTITITKTDHWIPFQCRNGNCLSVEQRELGTFLVNSNKTSQETKDKNNCRDQIIKSYQTSATTLGLGKSLNNMQITLCIFSYSM